MVLKNRFTIQSQLGWLYRVVPEIPSLCMSPVPVPSTELQEIFVSEIFRQKRNSFSSKSIMSVVARLLFGCSVAARLLFVYLPIHEYLWPLTCGFVKKLVRKSKNYFDESDEINSWRRLPAIQYHIPFLIPSPSSARLDISTEKWCLPLLISLKFGNTESRVRLPGTCVETLHQGVCRH